MCLRWKGPLAQDLEARGIPVVVLADGLDRPDYPVALGVLYCNPGESYDAAVHKQIDEAKQGATETDLNALLRRGHTWKVKPH